MQRSHNSGFMKWRGLVIFLEWFGAYISSFYSAFFFLTFRYICKHQ
ncbi:hypothetical protein FSS13T_27250 [Flavobacterium saliperosum S13]|uniref:Uncharacterized protein n=1 Tax=Flavobacterium saliperosum S13 TaxID=1341155 RepID=A0ABP3A029_9FLAO|nr:hypothetical protein FSS13T_27250 [Flavobacterium saliperosum S13]